MSKSDQRVKALVTRFLSQEGSPRPELLSITQNCIVHIFLNDDRHYCLRVILYNTTIFEVIRRTYSLQVTFKTGGFNTATTARYLHASVSGIEGLSSNMRINLRKGKMAISTRYLREVPFEEVEVSYERVRGNTYFLSQVTVDGEYILGQEVEL